MLRKRLQGEEKGGEEEISQNSFSKRGGPRISTNFFFKLFRPYEKSPEDGKYALQLHLFYQVIFFGLLMVGILLVEVISLNLISQPTDQQKTTFNYEIKRQEHWQAQLFREYFHKYIFGESVVRNYTSYEDGLAARKFQYDLFFAHYYLYQMSVTRFFNAKPESFTPHIQNTYYKLYPHYYFINYTMVEILNEVQLEEPKIVLQFDDYNDQNLEKDDNQQYEEYGKFVEYIDQLVSEEIEREETIKNQVMNDLQAITSAKKRTVLPYPNDCIHYIYAIDKRFEIIERILIDFISRPKENNISRSEYYEFYSESYGMLARLQRIKHIHWLYERALYQTTNDTLEAILIFDSGKHIFSSFGEQCILFWLIFRYDAVFDFGHMITSILILGSFWWFNSEQFYDHIPEENAGFFRWRKRSFSLILAMAINFFISMSILRSIRVVSYWSTILPNENIYCKLRKFKEGVTWSSPFIEQLIQVTTQANNTNGGCNDLIFSGHVSLYVMCSLFFYRYCPSTIITTMVYLVAMEPTIDAVIKGQHYSVDVLIAIYLTFIMDYMVNKDILPMLVGADACAVLQKARNASKKSFSTFYQELLFIFSVLKRILFYICCCFLCFKYPFTSLSSSSRSKPAL